MVSRPNLRGLLEESCRNHRNLYWALRPVGLTVRTAVSAQLRRAAGRRSLARLHTSEPLSWKALWSPIMMAVRICTIQRAACVSMHGKSVTSEQYLRTVNSGSAKPQFFGQLRLPVFQRDLHTVWNMICVYGCLRERMVRSPLLLKGGFRWVHSMS
jgi:hypothetical protein